MKLTELNMMVKEGIEKIKDGASVNWTSGMIELDGKNYYITIAIQGKK